MTALARTADRPDSRYPIVVALGGDERHIDIETARRLHAELGAALAHFEWSEPIVCTFCGAAMGADCAPRCPGDITELPPAIGGEEEA